MKKMLTESNEPNEFQTGVSHRDGFDLDFRSRIFCVPGPRGRRRRYVGRRNSVCRQPPTTQSRSVSDTVAIDLTKNALVYNSVPVLSLSEDELFNRRWYTVPGASFDGLRGLTLPDAFQFISNTFPQLTVRAVPIGEPISLEYRRDRVTVQYDAFNKRVISARIG